MNPGFVSFRVGERVFATPLDEVREIVRLEGLQALPGTRPPLAGVIVLRGVPLPVLDVRPPGATRGDVLVLEVDGDCIGVAVDRVDAVLHPDELPDADAAPSPTLPDYVVGLRRGRSGPVLLVDLHRLLDVTAAGWTGQLAVAAVGAEATG